MSERLHELASERNGADQPAAHSPVPKRTHHYPPKTLHGDLVRGVLGVTLTGGPLLLVRPVLAVEIALIICAVIFALYLGRTLLRYRTVVESDETGLRERALTTKSLPWAGVERIKLRFYTTRRSREDAGWLVLTLSGKNQAGRSTKIAIESTLTGFDDLLAIVAGVAVARSVDVDETTVHNFAGAGAPLRLPDEAGHSSD
jgi:hypothetical protein